MSRLNPTRQQLDELDALLQRMLALPAIEPEVALGAPIPPPPPPAARPAATPPATTWNVELSPPAPAVGGSWADLANAALAAESGRVTFERLPNHPPAFPGAPDRLTTRPISEPVAVAAFADTASSSAEASKPVMTESPLPLDHLGFFGWPAYILNVVFDWCISWFGPPGRFLAAPAGKGLLGWTGILMILGAIGWAVADAMGWIN